MITVIYRKTDNLVAGWVHPPQSVAVELQNILASELKGTASDYAMSTLDTLPPGCIPVIGSGGVAMAVTAGINRTAVRFKVQSALKLTDGEMRAMFS